ncbi:hypothetical protein DPMN_097248 [Dreissena polymorpha]|uniref:Uncharacterized protein n=1 Tax=Dreissena polymorpha TaxID=45954 RepID=A0A9D4R674_DREPO|nr:hypothetical protein DPMN_097248 [Dreissena polymorpha]
MRTYYVDANYDDDIGEHIMMTHLMMMMFIIMMMVILMMTYMSLMNYDNNDADDDDDDEDFDMSTVHDFFRSLPEIVVSCTTSMKRQLCAEIGQGEGQASPKQVQLENITVIFYRSKLLVVEWIF